MGVMERKKYPVRKEKKGEVLQRDWVQVLGKAGDLPVSGRAPEWSEGGK